MAVAHASTDGHDHNSPIRSSFTGVGKSGWRRRQSWITLVLVKPSRSAISAAPTRSSMLYATPTATTVAPDHLRLTGHES